MHEFRQGSVEDDTQSFTVFHRFGRVYVLIEDRHGEVKAFVTHPKVAQELSRLLSLASVCAEGDRRDAEIH